ncbi:MAG: hypothetical protein O3B24_01225 [Verrucomicrobia bacterium]|nr:hypothetical protein [Verrucomicrobiota bacterium]
MKRVFIRRMGIVAGCALTALLACGASAKDLELSIVVGSGAGYVAPDGRKILITHQPTEFTVQVRNNAKVSKQIWTDRLSGTLSKLRFEVRDDQGRLTVIAQKKVFGKGEVWASSYLDPGQAVARTIRLTPDAWENVSAVPPGEVRHLTVRAIYESDSETLRSEPYEVTIAPRAMPGVMTPPPAAAPNEPPPITVIH